MTDNQLLAETNCTVNISDFGDVSNWTFDSGVLSWINDANTGTSASILQIYTHIITLILVVLRMKEDIAGDLPQNAVNLCFEGMFWFAGASIPAAYNIAGMYRIPVLLLVTLRR